MPENEQPHRTTPGELLVRADRDADTVIVALQGELDLASAPKLEQELLEVEASGPRRVIIDLSGLSFMDSTGMRALLLAHRRSLSDEHELSLRRGSHQVQRVFELTGSLDTFKFED